MILVRKHLRSGNRKITLPPLGTDQNVTSHFRLSCNESCKKYYLVVRLLNTGDYFGVGEDLRKISVISVGRVSVVFYSRYRPCANMAAAN